MENLPHPEPLVNEHEEMLAARLLDFVDAKTPWHRALWNPGLILALEEILEASEAVQVGVLSDDLFSKAVGHVTRSMALDCGVGKRSNLKALQEILQPKFRTRTLNYFALRQLIDEIAPQYLSNWAEALRADAKTLTAERAARSIDSHLLDLDFDGDSLHRWWNYNLHARAGRSIADVVLDVHQIALAPLRDFDVRVALIDVPPKKFGRPEGWIEAHDLAKWLKIHHSGSSNVRHKGGLLLTVKARDARSAALAAAEQLESLATRARLATAYDFAFYEVAWVSGDKEPHPIKRRNRNLKFGVLIREKVVYDGSDLRNGLDAFLEILAPMQSGSPTAAIAAGWAAIESMLSDSNDKGGAAERLATIVACSFPRAELTALSYKVDAANVDLLAKLATADSNRDRSEIIAIELLKNRQIVSGNWSDYASTARMKAILKRPLFAMQDIYNHLVAAFHRLYRQRNLVLHGGRNGSVALKVCLRNVAPLIGAGMDRIAHGYHVNGMSPMETAARAQLALTRLTDGDSLACIDMLR